MYVGTVPNQPGAHTFTETIDGLQNRLVEVVTLCLEYESVSNKETIKEKHEKQLPKKPPQKNSVNGSKIV